MENFDFTSAWAELPVYGSGNVGNNKSYLWVLLVLGVLFVIGMGVMMYVDEKNNETKTNSNS